MNLLQNFQNNRIYVYGKNGVVGTAIEELYLYNQPLDWLTIMATAAAIDISSTSTADTASAGTGAQVIRVIGTDVNGNIIYEDISMTGQTKKASTVLFKTILGAEVIQTGTGKVNAGIIHIVKTGTGGTYTTGTPGTLTSALCQIPVATMESMNGIYVVPAGKTAKVHLVAGISRTQGATVIIQREPLTGLGPLQTVAVPLELGPTSPESFMRGIRSYTFPEKTLIRLRATGAAASAVVTASMEISLS